MRTLGHWINGKADVCDGSEYLTTCDPRSGEPVALVALGGAAEAERAVAGARAAQTDWAGCPASDRGRIVAQLGRAIKASKQEIAELEISETGKLANAAVDEIEKAADYFEYYGGIVRAMAGDHIDLGSDQFGYIRREPYPVTAIITPWNFPAVQAARDIAPCLVAGGAAVVKPSEFTSSSVLAMARLGTEAGLPEGVLNVITGTGADAGANLVGHKGVEHVMFTGSVAAGRTVAQAAAARGVPTLLELGGKGPIVVFADADLASASVAVSRFTQHCGQVCTAFTRLIVHHSVHHEVVSRVRKIIEALHPGVDLGPLTTAAQFRKVQHYFEVAKADGARLVTGGKVADEGELAKGQYVYPTIYDDVTPLMTIFQDEIFGPVLTVTSFDEEEEAIRLANATEYGLGAAVWTKDVGRVHRVVARIEAGQIWVNGGRNSLELAMGGYRASGHGRARGMEGLLHCTRTKSVVMALS